MTGDVVLLHGAGTGAHDEDAALARSLALHLGAERAVRYPRLPEDEADEQPWLDAMAAAIAPATPPLVLVGHSMGGYLLLKLLATRGIPAAIEAVCLIAAPFPGADAAWTLEGFALPDGLDALLPPGARVLLYASQDDATVPFAHRDRYAAAIPRAVVRTTRGGHQLGDDLRAVAEDILALG